MSLLIGPDTTFTRMESALANMAGHKKKLRGEVYLLIGVDIRLTIMGSVFANRAGYNIY